LAALSAFSCASRFFWSSRRFFSASAFFFASAFSASCFFFSCSMRFFSRSSALRAPGGAGGGGAGLTPAAQAMVARYRAVEAATQLQAGPPPANAQRVSPGKA